MSTHHPSTVVEGLLSLFEHERVHFSKMIASLMPILNMLTSADLGPLLSPEVATQTCADFVARTGSEAKAREVLGNINNLIALR